MLFWKVFGAILALFIAYMFYTRRKVIKRLKENEGASDETDGINKG